LSCVATSDFEYATAHQPVPAVTVNTSVVSSNHDSLKMASAAVVYALKQRAKQAEYVTVTDEASRDDPDNPMFKLAPYNHGRPYQILKSVLISESGFFRAMFRNNFKVKHLRSSHAGTDFHQETETSEVHLYDDHV
jgi:hypothetical protein